MTIKDVKILQTCPTETLVNARHQIFTGTVAAIRSRPHFMTGLGRNNHFIPVALKVLSQNPAEIGFRTSGNRTVIVCQIKMSDSMIKSKLNHVGRYLEIVHTAEIMPQSQRDKRKLQTTFAAIFIRHPFVTVGNRLIIERIFHKAIFL